jgi:protein-cysteine N-palmitoyltransferase HHAT
VAKKKQLDPANLSEKDRVAIPANAEDFSFRNYVAYALYGPLYIAGPIMTFNEYISQSKFKSATIETSRTIRYGARFVLVLLATEVTLHLVYVCAISLAYPDWSTYTPAQLSILSFLNLHVIWLKLLLPWRLFRLWALVDGIDPPENMVRCVSNNFSPRLFWRSWHRSYNRWLIRYIFVPLGGSNFKTWRNSVRSMMTFTLVFTFVALWHDIKLRLLIWGWLIVLFFIPEIVGKYLFPAKRFEGMETTYRMLSCGGAVFNVLMMITANLVGFAVGVEGLRDIVRGILHDFSGKAPSSYLVFDARLHTFCLSKGLTVYLRRLIPIGSIWWLLHGHTSHV